MKKLVLILSLMVFPLFLCQCSSPFDNHIRKGEEFFLSNNYEKALEHYEAAIKKNPDSKKGYIGKAKVLNKLNKDRDALTECFNAMELDGSDASLYDIEGSLMVDLGDPENAIRSYDKAISLDSENGSYYSNKAYALNVAGNFEEAIKCCDKALEFFPDLDMAYNNKAFAFYSLGKWKEALEQYDKAIEISPYNDTAYYNKGVVYLDMQEYKSALDCFNKALGADFNKDILFNIYIKKAETLYELEEYEEAIRFADNALSLDINSSRAYMLKGLANCYMQEYENAERLIDKSIELDENNPDAYVSKSKLFIEQEQYDKAEEFCNKALEISSSSAFAYNTLGFINLYINKYKDATNFFDKAIEAEPNSIEGYLNMSYVLFYYLKNYTKCLEFSNNASELFPHSYVFPWYVADCYSYQGKSDKSIEQYNKILEIEPENVEILSSLAWEHYHAQDYSKSAQYNEKVLEIYAESENAKTLKSFLEDVDLPESERVANFIKYNYLYLDKIKNFDTISNRFLSNKEVTVDEIKSFVESIRNKNDLFTYVIDGDLYDEMVSFDLNNTIVEKHIDKNTVFLQFNMFTSSTGYKFREIVEDIENPEETNLIIDLRDNPGGLLAESNEMLDLLLPECTTSYLIYRDGYIEDYISDRNQVKFKNIFIMVNENSASSSEVLALGLKKYLDNVYIVGRPTLGKGVGQIVYENKAKKYMIYLVSFYWNVKEENVSGGKIRPDIYVSGNSDQSYIDAINRTKRN
jgi:tetratricopeptide (TPR) repeat protein